LTTKKVKKPKKPSVQDQLKSALATIQAQDGQLQHYWDTLCNQSLEIEQLRGAIAQRDTVVVKLDARVVSLIGSIERLSHKLASEA
jgi:hypothetical protein